MTSASGITQQDEASRAESIPKFFAFMDTPPQRQNSVVLNDQPQEWLQDAFFLLSNPLPAEPFNGAGIPSWGRMIQRRPTDEELMLTYQGGSKEAFEELFARYRTRLFNYFRRSLGDPVQADDLLQTLFLQVHRARHTYQPAAAFSTWVYTIARNLVRDALDKERVERARRVTTRTSQRAPDEEPVPVEERIADAHTA